MCLYHTVPNMLSLFWPQKLSRNVQSLLVLGCCDIAEWNVYANLTSCSVLGLFSGQRILIEDGTLSVFQNVYPSPSVEPDPTVLYQNAWREPTFLPEASVLLTPWLSRRSWLHPMLGHPTRHLSSMKTPMWILQHPHHSSIPALVRWLDTVWKPCPALDLVP